MTNDKLKNKYNCVGCLDRGFYYLPDDLSKSPIYDHTGRIIPQVALCYCDKSKYWTITTIL